MILIAIFALLACTQVFRMVRWARIQDRREREILKLHRMFDGASR
jgi:Flp pilus assembly protein TadB